MAERDDAVLKLIGTALVLIAGTLAGFAKAKELADRPQQIRELVHALQSLATEIGYGFTPLPQALGKLGKRLSAPLSALFQATSEQLSMAQGLSVDEVWRENVLLLWPKTALRRTEKEILLQLGAILGASGKEDQLKHLHLAIHELQREEAEALEERRRYEKMWKSLGFLLGALVVIVLY
ncbi:MAG TPA: stage III sporulation protein SpoIIIAB [Bacilli bacterium]